LPKKLLILGQNNVILNIINKTEKEDFDKARGFAPRFQPIVKQRFDARIDVLLCASRSYLRQVRKPKRFAKREF
jgi:hypothetical protein